MGNVQWPMVLLFPPRIVNAFLETRLNTGTIRNAGNIFKITLLPFTGEPI